MEDDNAVDIYKWMFSTNNNDKFYDQMEMEYNGTLKKVEVSLNRRVLLLCRKIVDCYFYVWEGECHVDLQQVFSEVSFLWANIWIQLKTVIVLQRCCLYIFHSSLKLLFYLIWWPFHSFNFQPTGYQRYLCRKGTHSLSYLFLFCPFSCAVL